MGMHDQFHAHESFAPEFLNRIGSGDWSYFQEIFGRDGNFEAYFGAGSTEWNFG